MSNIDQIVINNIKKYLHKNKIQQKIFAKKIGCDESTFCRYLRHERKLPLIFAIKSSEVMNISLDKLIKKEA